MSEREFVHMSTMCAATRADIISPGAAGGYELPGTVLELSWDSLQEQSMPLHWGMLPGPSATFL